MRTNSVQVKRKTKKNKDENGSSLGIKKRQKKNKNEDEFSLGIKKRPKKKKKLGWVHFRYREISMKSGFH